MFFLLIEMKQLSCDLSCDRGVVEILIARVLPANKEELRASPTVPYLASSVELYGLKLKNCSNSALFYQNV